MNPSSKFTKKKSTFLKQFLIFIVPFLTFNMSVVIETTKGTFTVDLYTEQRPKSKFSASKPVGIFFTIVNQTFQGSLKMQIQYFSLKIFNIFCLKMVLLSSHSKQARKANVRINVTKLASLCCVAMSSIMIIFYFPSSMNDLVFFQFHTV